MQEEMSGQGSVGTLHISAKDAATDNPVPLRELVLFSDVTTVRGKAHLESGAVISGNPAEVLGGWSCPGRLD